MNDVRVANTIIRTIISDNANECGRVASV